jgi:hypothetical protein
MIERGGESLQKNNFFKEITTEEKKGKGGKSSYARQARLEAMTAHPKPWLITNYAAKINPEPTNRPNPQN